MTFEIKTEAFEGPLELLLELIEKRKLFIGDISLAAVADEYLARVQNMGEFPLSEAAQFLLVASTLLLIKSKALLPELQLSTEEQADIGDLERRLALYKMFQELSGELRPLWGRRPLYMPAENRRAEQIVFAPHAGITPPALSQAIGRIVVAFPKPEVLKKAVVEKVMTLEEMIEKLAARVKEALTMSFKNFALRQAQDKPDGTARETRVTMIVSFLAMLELVKQGMVRVSQEAQFDDIEMEAHGVDVPRY